MLTLGCRRFRVHPSIRDHSTAPFVEWASETVRRAAVRESFTQLTQRAGRPQKAILRTLPLRGHNQPTVRWSRIDGSIRRFLWMATAIAAVSLSGRSALAVVRPASIFAHHMVLQRDMPVPVWGTADPGEDVTVAIAGQSATTKTGADGKWIATLGKLDAGGPHTLTVKGKNTYTFTDVLVGEVWLASGQSNMVTFVVSTPGFDQIKSEANLPEYRYFDVGQRPAREPRPDCSGSWRACTPELVGGFSATSFFFGRELHQKLGVPVGIINSALGSTPIEAWTSLDAQRGKPELKELLDSWEQKSAAYDPAAAQAAYEKDREAWNEAAQQAKAAGKPVPREPRPPIPPRDQQAHPAVMFNASIAPLIPLAVRGIIWYQGEFNTQTEEYAALYRHQLPLLIQDWRSRWDRDDLPFAWVQLPNFDTTTRTPRMTGWPLVREGQLLACSLPHTGMAVTIDIGEPQSVHPRNKQAFSHRLALWARAEVYGEKIPWSGPLFASHVVSGKEVELRFRQADGGLVVKGSALKGFEIAGADKRWHPAEARIANDTVIVSSTVVEEPAAVRYSWADNPEGNLFNAAGLPASPFRTDRNGFTETLVP